MTASAPLAAGLAGAMTAEVAPAPDAGHEGAGHDGAKRRQIMEGARQVFLHAGFDGASMNDVAREAGVSKGTLYVYFASKEALFEALVRDGKARQGERLAQLSDEFEPAETLRRFGVSLLLALTSPESIAQVRTIVGVSAKFPQIGRAFYDAGLAYGVEMLSRYLAAQTQAGRLRAPEPETAAMQFIDLCKAGLMARVLFGVVDAVSQAEIEANVARALDTFMAAFGPQAAG